MQSANIIEKLEIRIDKISYDSNSKHFSVNILGFTFLGHYKKTTPLKIILDEIFKSLKDIQVNRNNIYFIDPLSSTKISESAKLKDILDYGKKPIVKKKMSPKGKKMSQRPKVDQIQYTSRAPQKDSTKEEEAESYKIDESDDMERTSYKKEAILSELNMQESAVPPPPLARSGPPSAPGAPAPSGASGKSETKQLRKKSYEDGISDRLYLARDEKEKVPKKYDINMGFQYYSVMMENVSYLFYVYFSQKELIIEDEKGKTVFKTSFQIVTEVENPVLDLRIEGKGFEIHPLTGKIQVVKDFIKPPVMIFSIVPKKDKSKEKKKKKEEEKRFLHVYIDFEGKKVNHTVLSVTVQPKHFHLDVGPLHLNMSKKTAILVSLLSIMITGISAVYALFTIDISTASSTDFLGSLGPGVGSLLFFIVFIVTLLKKGVFPIKDQIAGLLNLDKGITTMK